MHTSQWLYNSPVFPDSIHWSEEHFFAANVGSTVNVAAPYTLKDRGFFTAPRGVDPTSVTNVGASPNSPNTSLSFVLETLHEFTMQDSGWAATVKTSCWSPRGAREGRGCLLAIIQSDRRVLIYEMPQLTASEMPLVMDLTQPMEMYIRQTDVWQSVYAMPNDLRLRGGGRHREEKLPLVDKASDATKQLVHTYQLPEVVDETLTPSLEASDSGRFRIDLPKVVLSLWMEIRSKIPLHELPRYRKGDQLFGIDRQIYDKVVKHIFQFYEQVMKTHGVDQRYLEIRSRSLIRKKAIVSYDTAIWKGKNFSAMESVLSLIGQKASEESLKSVRKPMVVSNKESALMVNETNGTIRLVKPHAGHKKKSPGFRKGALKSHFQVTDTNFSYHRKLALLSASSIAWSPIFCWNNIIGSLLALGMSSGHLVLCWLSAKEHNDPVELSRRLQFLMTVPVMNSEITVMKWMDYRLGAEYRKVLFLAIGDVSGEVKFFNFTPEALLQGGISVMAPDSRPVHCLHLEMTMKLPNSPELLLCVGKSCGTFAVWRSPPLSALMHDCMAFSKWIQSGEIYWKFLSHNCQSITGISSTPFEDQIVTVGLDSRIHVWRMDQGKLQQQPSIQEGDKEMQPVYGLAISPTGMMMGIVKDLGEKFADAQRHRMVWKRVAHGSIDLINFVNLDDRASWQKVFDHLRKLIMHRANDDLTSIARDIGFIVKWYYLGSVAQLEDEEFKEKAGYRLQKAMQFLRVVFTLLEGTENETKMRATNALYYTLKDTQNLQIDKGPVWTLELALLENYVNSVLDMKAQHFTLDRNTWEHFENGDHLQLIKEAMAEWILQFPDLIKDTLVRKATDLLTRDHQLADVEDPILAATQSTIRFENSSIVSERCYVTFRRIQGTALWRCPTCSRCCLVPFSKLLQKHMASCLFCGSYLIR